MSKTAWKLRERQAAAILGGKRFAANTGGRLDGESSAYVWQVKERKSLSLAQLEALAVELDRIGSQKTKQGLVMVKRSAGRGVRTPWLVVMTEGVFRELNGVLPIDTQSEGERD